MKKSKSFTQYNGDGFTISVSINTNGIIINKNRLILYGKESNTRNQQYYIEHIEVEKLRRKQYRKVNKEKIKLHCKQYYENNKDKIKLKAKRYRENNKDKENLRYKLYYIDHKKEAKEYHKQYCKDNPEMRCKWRHKSRAKRHGWGIPQPINNWFENSHLHHLHLNENHRIAIYIPTDLHKSVWHAYNKPKTMAIINKLALEWLATQDIII